MVPYPGSFLLYLSLPKPSFLHCECGGAGEVSMSLLAYILLIITDTPPHEMTSFQLSLIMTVADFTSVTPQCHS